MPKWLPLLASAYLDYLQARRRRLGAPSAFLMPLPAAIAKLIYTICKIRGEKVVVGFLTVETRYLELLLTRLEEAESASLAAPGSAVSWSWEERYVVLLWLSQLFLAPFDLATISSGDIDDDADLPPIPDFRWPAAADTIPGLTARVLPLAIRYLASPGRERDAAKALLVRVALRRDMQGLGILRALVNWALASLGRPVHSSPYHHIGVLSFLAGILRSSSDASDLDDYLNSIFHTTHALATAANGGITSSALARKMVIKVLRSVAEQILRRSARPDGAAATELVETTIGHFLERLADNDTPVRLAASKALGVITLGLAPDLASQVIDAVLGSLNHNVRWVRNAADPAAPRTRDLTSVDPLEWHGLMLTLSHLLYRRSPPAGNLADVVHALLLGLSFERRSPSGGSIGANVRDAACFGIWALARRYSTAEILAVPTQSISVATSRDPGVSVLQVVAAELVVTASLDPAGNIRRGSAAALQELIGRHPDTVEEGIGVVQAVDYHAVALRSRAISEVAMSAMRLSGRYGDAILAALLGWRGIGDADATARRTAATAFGAITAEMATGNMVTSPLQQLVDTVDTIIRKLEALQLRQVDERHGVLLCLAAVLDAFPTLVAAELASPSGGKAISAVLRRVTGALQMILDKCKSTTFRRPELVAEAAARLVVSCFPILQAAILGADSRVPLMAGPALLASTNTRAFSDIVSAIDLRHSTDGHGIPDELLSLLQANLSMWLNRPEEDVISATSEAALVVLIFSGPEDGGDIQSRNNTIRAWADAVLHPSTNRTGAEFGYFFALTKAHPMLPHIPPRDTGQVEAGDNALICRAVLGRWASDQRIETRVALLQALTQSDVLVANVSQFLGLIAEGLDDYTTNARGDIGSHVRLQALRATKGLWRSIDDGAGGRPENVEKLVSQLFLRILRLAAEKLDRVRTEAHSTLTLTLQPG